MDAVKRPDYLAFTFLEGDGALKQLGFASNDLTKSFFVQSCKILRSLPNYLI